MTNLKIRQGQVIRLLVEQGDEDSISATLLMRNQETLDVITATATYTDGVAELVVDGEDTETVGIYDYQINENFSGGDKDKYPDPTDCDGEDCDFPTIEICDAIDVEGGSS